MRIYQLFHTIIDRFVPMDEGSKNELQVEASKHYMLIRNEAELISLENQKNVDWNAANPEETPKPLRALSLKHKAIIFLELWWVRYLIAASFVFLVPKIKQIINGEFGREDDGEDDSMNEFEEFKNFQRYKKSML
jgi:hypothetical protein